MSIYDQYKNARCPEKFGISTCEVIGRKQVPLFSKAAADRVAGRFASKPSHRFEILCFKTDFFSKPLQLRKIERLVATLE